jgi:hypothetical protein
MATGTVQARLRDESVWIADMKRPLLRVRGAIQKASAPGDSELRTLSQIRGKIHGQNFNGTSGTGESGPFSPRRRRPKTRTYFVTVKTPILFVTESQ